MKKAFRIIRKILSGALTVLLALIVVANVYTLAARGITGRQNVPVFGFSSAVVLTGSMSGAIEPNDMIITHQRSEPLPVKRTMK